MHTTDALTYDTLVRACVLSNSWLPEGHLAALPWPGRALYKQVHTFSCAGCCLYLQLRVSVSFSTTRECGGTLGIRWLYLYVGLFLTIN